MARPLTPDDPPSLGRYRLAGRLGEGGQGVVYLAHSEAGEPVAIKLLNTGDTATRARLARELEALESIASFCTARVLDASTDGSRPYVVSEFVDGPSLADRVRERGPLRGGELERLAVGTATALAAIHAAGVVHRDFKPANVLLGPDGPRVVDFGIARAEGAATMTSGLIGTPAYLAPEQIGGSPAAPASDVFAWAASMVFAGTGTSPFGADTVPAVLHRVLHTEPDLSPLPPRLREVLAASLAKDPALRPTARQLMVSLVDPRTPPAGAPRVPPPRPEPRGFPAQQNTGPQPRPPGQRGTGPPTPNPPHSAPQGPGTGPQGFPPGPVREPGQGTGPGAGSRSWPGPGGWSEGPTGPRPPAETTAEKTRRSGRRGLLIGVAAAVVALAAAGGTVLLLDRPLDIGAQRTPSATPSTPRSSVPQSTSAPERSASETASAPPSPEQSPSPSPPETPEATATRPGRPTGNPALKIPAPFEGDWSGHTTSTNPMDTDGADNEVKLEEGESTAEWSERNGDGDCKGAITLTKVETARLTFSLGQNEGMCIPGTITLELVDDTLTYTWRDVPGPGLVTQTGTLKKK